MLLSWMTMTLMLSLLPRAMANSANNEAASVALLTTTLSSFKFLLICPWRQLRTTSQTNLLETTSHNPSLATTTNSSHSVLSYTIVSGSDITKGFIEWSPAHKHTAYQKIKRKKKKKKKSSFQKLITYGSGSSKNSQDTTSVPINHSSTSSFYSLSFIWTIRLIWLCVHTFHKVKQTIHYLNVQQQQQQQQQPVTN